MWLLCVVFGLDLLLYCATWLINSVVMDAIKLNIYCMCVLLVTLVCVWVALVCVASVVCFGVASSLGLFAV